jgi:hypothetical protein
MGSALSLITFLILGLALGFTANFLRLHQGLPPGEKVPRWLFFPVLALGTWVTLDADSWLMSFILGAMIGTDADKLALRAWDKYNGSISE